MYNARTMDSENFPGRILAIDWGAKRIGIAISDETQTLARPLKVIASRSRIENAVRIQEIANAQKIDDLIIGVTYDQNGELSPTGRRAARLAEVLQTNTSLIVELVDESHSTKMAKNYKVVAGESRNKRKGHLDAEAAAVFLQDYLDRKNDGK